VQEAVRENPVERGAIGREIAPDAEAVLEQQDRDPSRLGRSRTRARLCSTIRINPARDR